MFGTAIQVDENENEEETIQNTRVDDESTQRGVQIRMQYVRFQQRPCQPVQQMSEQSNETTHPEYM